MPVLVQTAHMRDTFVRARLGFVPSSGALIRRLRLTMSFFIFVELVSFFSGVCCFLFEACASSLQSNCLSPECARVSLLDLSGSLRCSFCLGLSVVKKLSYV